MSGNFIGSKELHRFYEIVGDLCHGLFEARYADPRPLSGLHALTMALMALTEPGQTILLSTPESGAHPSPPAICRRLGLTIIEAPYDFERYDYDYDAIGSILSKSRVSAIVLAPSDILRAPALQFPDDSELTVVYDATQSLGLMAGGVWPSPTRTSRPLVMVGGTHKTLPGPTKGLLLTSVQRLAQQLDKTVNPVYMRNTQMSQVASLCLTLLEMIYAGHEYASTIIRNANHLGAALVKRGVHVVRITPTRYTDSHQLFLPLPRETAARAFEKALRCNITLNFKDKRLFGGAGLRLGVQEITRYGYSLDELDSTAQILADLISDRSSDESLRSRVGSLASRREWHFGLPTDIEDRLRSLLSQDNERQLCE